MNATRMTHRVLQAAVCSVVLSLPSQAAELSGAWASSAEVCSKIFFNNASALAIKDDADIYGSGFIIDGRKIRGRTAVCDIRSRSEDKGMVHIVASCATDIMLSSVQFSVKIIDENKISRFFPGIPEMEMYYDRCSL
jgi:hypothetical protein